MIKKITKLYSDYEKEEKWLNEMSAKGYHLIGYSFIRYTFEMDESKSYTYKIEYLKKGVNTAETRSYFEFLEETGIEVIDNYFNWVYLRKDLREGEFQLFTDYDSKIKHHKRIFLMQAPIGFLNLYIGFFNLFTSLNSGFINIYLAPINLILGIVICIAAFKQYKQIKKLKRERDISEY